MKTKTEIKQSWKAFVAHNSPTASNMITRNVLLGKPLKNGFTPIKNETKLQNGMRPFVAFENALLFCRLKDQPFEWALEGLSKEDRDHVLKSMREFLKGENA